MLENSNFWIIFDTVISLLEATVFFYFINNDNLKRKSNKIIYINFLVFLLFLTIVNHINIGHNERASISIILYIIFFKVNYNINIVKSIAITLIYWMFLMSIDSLSLIFVKFTNSLDDLNLIIKPGVFRIELIAISKTLLITAIVYSKLFKLLEKITTKDFIYLIIPIVTNIFSLFLVFGKQILDLSNKFLQNISLFLISVLVLLSNVFLIFIILKIIKDNTLIERQKLHKKKLKMEHDYHLRIEENNYKVRKLYHDMKSHLICIGNLCDNDEAIKYVNNLEFELNKLNNIYDTGNRILDIILNEKSYLCIEKNVKFNVSIDFSKSDFIDMLDINIIFSNAIDNAVQACDKINDLNISRKIDIRGRYVNNFIIIKIINTKDNEILKNKSKKITDRKDKFFYGIGLINIRESVEKYHGEVIIDNTDNEFILTIMIPLPINSI